MKHPLAFHAEGKKVTIFCKSKKNLKMSAMSQGWGSCTSEGWNGMCWSDHECDLTFI